MSFVFKKTLKIVTAFSVLLAAYAGYVRCFSVVSRCFPPPQTIVVQPVSEGLIQSATAQEATRLARGSFGSGHWSVKAPVRYYNSERGYWMFAESAEREREGKRYRFKPFAILWRSRDGRTLKTLTGDDAVADFDQPIDVIKPGAKSGHVVHGVINGHVLMRDDRATPADRSDDLEIGPLTYVEFDEPTLQIRSNSDVYVKDRDTEITGNGMLIELRPHEGPTRKGFNGAKTMWLLRNVNVHSKNVGQSGILPGTVKSADANAPTPLDLKCLGAMKVALPEPQPPLAPGEKPPPPRPTLAWFNRNVRVRRGTDRPDQLDCDELFLTLFPTPKPPV